MANMDTEKIKKQSKALRGSLIEELAQETTHFNEENMQLLKFHGVYQGDNRDLRAQRRKEKLEPAYELMVRSKIPGGMLTAEQYLAHDRAARDLGNGSLRITSRQSLQFHSVIKGDLKELLQRLSASGIHTWGACGDVVRNVIASPAPYEDEVHRTVQELAVQLSAAFHARSRAYSEIWLDGERLPGADEPGASEEETIYGETYLPRKFKIAIAIPPRNDVDIYTNDLGFIAHEQNGRIEGYTVVVGGGLGMTAGNVETYPRLASPLFFIAPEDVLEVAKAVVTVQRDFGNRENRKLSRLKYLLDERGVDWFRQEVGRRIPQVKTAPPRKAQFTSLMDPLGWHRQGADRWFFGVRVDGARIDDFEHLQYRSAFRELAERFASPMRFTANHNVLFCNLREEDKAQFEAILRKHHIPMPEDYTKARRFSMACVALPTCSLALAESERVFGGVMTNIEAILRELNLQNEPILFRMTGCANGCSRPYNADFAFVGRMPNKYALFIGGSPIGDQLAQLWEKQVELEEIPNHVRRHLEDFVSHRQGNETFSQFWTRERRRESFAQLPDEFHQPASQPDKTAEAIIGCGC